MVYINKDIKDFKIVRSFNGGLRLRSESLFKDIKSERYKNFLEDVFDIRGVKSVDTSPLTRTVRILYDPAEIRGKALCSNLKKILSNSEKYSHKERCQSVNHLILNENIRRLNRFGDVVTTWQVKHSSSGRLRVTHPILYRRSACFDYIEKKMLNTPGIEKLIYNPNSQSILITYQAEKINEKRILSILHLSLAELVSKLKPKDRYDVQRPLTVTSLGLAAAGDYLFPWLIPLSTTLVYYSAKPTFDKAKKNILKKRKFGVEILDSLVTLSCLATGQVFAAALMVFLVGIGRNMLNKPSEETKRLLSRVIYKVPRFTWLIKGKKRIEISIQDLKEGDRIVLEKGDIVPVDGLVYKGTAVLNECNLTGQMDPIKKKAKDEVYASSKIISGKIYIEVKKTASESIVAKLKEVIFKTANYKIKAHRIGEKVQANVILPTLGASLMGYGMGGFDSAMAVVTADYGTGIKVTTPMGFLATLGIATKHRIFIKEGAAFERLAKVDTFLFKKNESLLERQLKIEDVIKLDGIGRNEILGYAVAATDMFYNSLTKALIGEARQLNIDIPKIYRANGMAVTGDGVSLIVGNDLLIESYGIYIPTSIKDRLIFLRHRRRDLVLVALDKNLVGAVEVGRTDSFLATGIIQDLKKKGVKDIILTSSRNDRHIKELANSLGIETCYNGISNKEEARLINRLHKDDRKVAMVSDTYANTCPKADVFISLGGVSDIENNKADVILQKEDFIKLPLVLDISRNLRNNTRRTVGLIAVPNTLCICGAMFGVFGFVQVLLLNSGFNFLATLSNSIPLYRTYEEELQEEHQMKP